MVGFALQAAEELAKEGIEAEVIDLRTLRPLDHATVVESVKKTNRLVTVEEGWGPMGVGAEVAARVVEEAFDWLDAPPARVHQEDVPMPYAANLEALSLPSVAEDRQGGQGGLLPMSAKNELAPPPGRPDRSEPRARGAARLDRRRRPAGFDAAGV